MSSSGLTRILLYDDECKSDKLESLIIELLLWNVRAQETEKKHMATNFHENVTQAAFFLVQHNTVFSFALVYVKSNRCFCFDVIPQQSVYMYVCDSELTH